MKLSIIIPTHKRHEEVFKLLESIGNQEATGLIFEVIVVSNLVDERLVKKLQSRSWPFPWKLTVVGSVGVNKARNLGLKESLAPWVYYLDDDVRLTSSQHLTRLMQIAEESSAVAVGGEYLLSQDVKLIDHVYHFISMSWLKKPSNIVSLVGGNTLYKRNMLGEELLFNEAISFGGAETELNLRLQKAAFPLFLSSDIPVEHQTQLALSDLVYKGFRQGMGHYIHQTIFPQVDLNKNHNLVDYRSEIQLVSGQVFIAHLYYLIYRFFFNIGYRHGIKSQKLSFSWPVFIHCFATEILPWPLTKSAYTPHPQALPFHRKSRPKLKLDELYHWSRANVFWKIPHFIRWKIVHFFLEHVPNFFKWNIINPILWHALPIFATYCTYFLWYLSPFNTIGLRVPYNAFCNRLESMWKRNRE